MALIYHGTMDISTNSNVKSIFVHFCGNYFHTNESAKANSIVFNTNIYSIPPKKHP